MNRRGFFKSLGAVIAALSVAPALIGDAALTKSNFKYRKLKCTWSAELEQDLKMYHGIDAEKEFRELLTHEMNEEIKREIDGEVIEIISNRTICPHTFAPKLEYTVKYT